MNLREWALPIYTILIQLATGLLFSLWIIYTVSSLKFRIKKEILSLLKMPALIIFATIVFGVIGAHFHLSRPYLSFLAIRNFHTSWLSREIHFTVLFSLFTGLLLLLLWFDLGSISLINCLGWIAVLTGLITIYCMSQIYRLPTQIIWNTSATMFSYYGTTFLLGAPSIIVVLLMDYRISSSHDPSATDLKAKIIKTAFPWSIGSTVASAILIIVVFLCQITSLRHMNEPSAIASLDLLFNLYRPLLFLRYTLLLAGIAMAILWWRRLATNKALINELLGPLYIACMFVLTAEIIGRFLFYASHVRIGF